MLVSLIFQPALSQLFNALSVNVNPRLQLQGTGLFALSPTRAQGKAIQPRQSRQEFLQHIKMAIVPLCHALASRQKTPLHNVPQTGARTGHQELVSRSSMQVHYNCCPCHPGSNIEARPHQLLDFLKESRRWHGNCIGKTCHRSIELVEGCFLDSRCMENSIKDYVVRATHKNA